jgi:hypothetical protein
MPRATPTRITEGNVSPLYIHLQEGFTNDLVIVRVNSTEVFRRPGVTTKLLLGYAEVFETEVPDGETLVEVEVPTRNLSGATRVRGADTPYLGVSFDGDTIRFQESATPFGYA